MIVNQTVKLKLVVNDAQSERLSKTVDQYATAFNAVALAGWQSKTTNGVKLHHKTYRTLRERLDLPSQLVISARTKAVEALKSVQKRSKQGKRVGCPQTSNPSIRFDARSFRFDWNGSVRLTVIGGRIELPVVLSPYSEAFKGLKICSSDLVRRPNGWFLHIVVEKEVPENATTGNATTGNVIGVDRGICRPAVTSSGKFLGDCKWKAIEEKLLALRRRLQSKGTSSARRHLKRLNDRLARFRRDCDHVISKKLVQSARPGDTLVFESLKNIRSNAKAYGKINRRKLHSWSFSRLKRLVDYKAALRGINVVEINPKHTSRRCPACGLIDKKNRPTQNTFRCVGCKYERNADLVAAWNIRDAHRGLWSPVSTVSGPVNAPDVEGCKPIRKPSISVEGG